MRRICQYVLAPRISKRFILLLWSYAALVRVFLPFLEIGGVSIYLLVLYVYYETIDILLYSLCYIFALSLYRTLVICDSRGAKLRSLLRDRNIRCVYYRGAGLRYIARMAYAQVGRYQPLTCLIIAGINDLTLRLQRPRRVVPRFADAFDLANYVIDLILSVRRDLLACYPWLRVAFGGINGICLNKYNITTEFHSEQKVIDQAILQVNSYIRLLNQNSRLYHPRLTSKVHAWRRGRMVTRYKYLYDGLHPNDVLLSQWARAIRRFHCFNTLGVTEVMCMRCLLLFWNKLSGCVLFVNYFTMWSCDRYFS